MTTDRTPLWRGAGDLPLSGIRVVDFGQYVAGPLAALLLAEQGADVIRVEPPGGPRWNGDANAVLLRGRRSVVLDLHDPRDRARAARLVSTADVVVENFRPGVTNRLGIGAAAMTSRNPRLVYCSMPGFGEADERAASPGWEGVVMAAAGAYSADLPTSLLAGDDTTGGVAFSPLPLASTFAALEAVTAIAAALLARERDGLGQWIEVPLFDALAEAVGVRALSFERAGQPMADFGHGIFQCSDGGYVSLIMVQFRHVEWLLRGFGIGPSSAIPSDPAAFRAADGAGAALRATLVELFATRPAAAWEAKGRALGLPIARLRSTAEWLREAAAVESGAVVVGADPHLGEVRMPGAAVALSDAPAPALAPRSPAADGAGLLAALDAWEAPDELPDRCAVRFTPPLQGVRVLDMTRVVAGPTAAKLLAQLGADVLMVDTDPATRPAALDEPVFHEALNRGKRSAIVDLRTPDGRATFDALAATADVVVQNSTTAALERLDVVPETLRAAHPTMTVVSLNTFGRQGPWAADRGYAEIANVVTGVALRTAPDPIPSGSSPLVDRPRWPFTDYAGGLLGAFGAVVSLYDRATSGRAHAVEVALVRAAALEQVMYAFDHDAKVWDEPHGVDARGWSDWDRLYEARDGWLYIVVPEGARQRVHDALTSLTGDGDGDRSLEDIIAALPAEDVVASVEGAGAGAHHVSTIDELLRPGGAWDRRGLRLEDESPHRGRVVMIGAVARLHRTPLHNGELPEPFGEATAAVVRDGWNGVVRSAP